MHISSIYCASVLTKIEKVTRTLHRILAKTNNPRLSYSDFNIEYLGSPHLGFYGRWISIIVQPQRTHNAPIYQISATFDNPQLRY